MEQVPNPGLTSRFSHLDFEIRTNNPRYTEVKSWFSEPGLAQGESLLIRAPGLMVTYMTLESREGLVIPETTGGEEVNSVFVRKGQVASRFTQLANPLVAQKDEHVFMYNPDSTGRHQIHQGQFEALHINYDLGFFKSLLQTAEDRQTDRLWTSLDKKETFLMAPDRFCLQAQMQAIFEAVRQEGVQGPTRLLILESRLLQLLSAQLEQLTRQTTPAGSGLSPADTQKLREVHQYIEQHYLQPLSLTQLCQLFGLNEFKLKKGYKLLFQTTVFGHILCLRLAQARELLTRGQCTVTEVADLVGYSHVAAFSAAFRKRYGFPPSKIAVR